MPSTSGPRAVPSRGRARYRREMHGGRPAGRILLAVALLALPLIGFAVLRDGAADLPASPVEDALLRLAPGSGSETRAVRPAPDAEAGARSAPGGRDLGLLVVLLATTGAAALAVTRGPRRPAFVLVRTGRRLAAPVRGPPVRFPR